MTTTTTPQTLTLPNDSGTLSLSIYGPADAPLIICSPAMGDTRDSYHPLAVSLSTSTPAYRVALLDLRGHGDSSTTFASYGDEATATDYLATIKALSPNAPVVLIGSSMSSAAAYIAAAKAPAGSVKGVVLMAPFLRNPPYAKVMMAIMRVMLWRPWGPTVWRFYAATLWPGLAPAAKSARVKKTVGDLTRPGRWSAFQKTVGGIDHDRAVKPVLGEVKCPALVVVGDKDPDWSKPEEEMVWVAGRFEKGGEMLLVEGAGHAPFLEKPEVVTPRVEEFLREIGF